MLKRATTSNKSNEFDLKMDVLGHNDGTGFCQNVLDGRAGKIYNRLQSSFTGKSSQGNQGITTMRKPVSLMAGRKEP